MKIDHDKFVDYYEAESLTDRTLERFSQIKIAVERAARLLSAPSGPWKVADVGCGAGTQCRLWANDGHDVFGIDINEKLVELGKRRAMEDGVRIKFEVGSATSLPWEDASMDIVLCPELLEHVEDWRSCVEEIGRVVRPGGIVFLSTTNWLCPSQQEFDLPAYSWYPGWLKRRYERLSVTTRPELVNHAKYPAVHWFSYYQLRRVFRQLGFRSRDRFDIAATVDHGQLGNILLRAIQAAAPIRFCAQVASPGTIIFAQKVDESIRND